MGSLASEIGQLPGKFAAADLTEDLAALPGCVESTAAPAPQNGLNDHVYR